MINLLPQKDQAKIRFAAYKRTAYTLTTLLLVIYVVSVAAVAGWWFFLAQAEERTTQEVAELTQQVAQLEAQEIMLRRLGERMGKTDAALQKHTQLAKVINQVLVNPAVTVVDWDFRSNKQMFTVRGTDTVLLQSYVDGLKTNLADLAVKTLSRKDKPEWEIAVEIEQ